MPLRARRPAQVNSGIFMNRCKERRRVSGRRSAAWALTEPYVSMRTHDAAVPRKVLAADALWSNGALVHQSEEDRGCSGLEMQRHLCPTTINRHAGPGPNGQVLSRAVGQVSTHAGARVGAGERYLCFRAFARDRSLEASDRLMGRLSDNEDIDLVVVAGLISADRSVHFCAFAHKRHLIAAKKIRRRNSCEKRVAVA